MRKKPGGCLAFLRGWILLSGGVLAGAACLFGEHFALFEFRLFAGIVAFDQTVVAHDTDPDFALGALFLR